MITALYFKITVTFVFVTFCSINTNLKLMYSIISLLVDVSCLIIPWGGRMVIKLYTHKIMLAILNIIHLAIFYHNLIKEKLRYFRFKIWIFSCILIQSSSSKRDMKSIYRYGLELPALWKCTELGQEYALNFRIKNKINV